MLHVNPFRVLVLCTGNSARSQIGEALLTTRGARRASGVVVAHSAGTHPAARVNPFALETLAAHGIVWESAMPKLVDEFAHEPFELVITVCDSAREACPIFPGAAAQVHWGMPDPADHVEPVAARDAFEATFQTLSQRVDALLALPIETMNSIAIQNAAQRIHDDASA